MRTLILDIETCGLPQAKDWLEPLAAPANYKKPESIAEYIAEAEAARLERLALDPDCCRTVAIGFVDAGLPLDPTVYLMANEAEERAHLKLFADIYRQQETRIVTFNGHKFDLPVLMRRAMYLDVPFPILNVDRYRSEHIDLWQKLSFNGVISAHSLKFYAKRLGIGTLDKVDGSQISALVKADTPESWQAIHDHVLSDVGLTHALAMRLGYVPRLAERAA
jgi:DNA polymerase elongation subunit (family B)